MPSAVWISEVPRTTQPPPPGVISKSSLPEGWPPTRMRNVPLSAVRTGFLGAAETKNGTIRIASAVASEEERKRIRPPPAERFPRPESAQPHGAVHSRCPRDNGQADR